jgi:hypothetical protein
MVEAGSLAEPVGLDIGMSCVALADAGEALWLVTLLVRFNWRLIDARLAFNASTGASNAVSPMEIEVSLA